MSGAAFPVPLVPLERSPGSAARRWEGNEAEATALGLGHGQVPRAGDLSLGSSSHWLLTNPNSPAFSKPPPRKKEG